MTEHIRVTLFMDARATSVCNCALKAQPVNQVWTSCANGTVDCCELVTCDIRGAYREIFCQETC